MYVCWLNLMEIASPNIPLSHSSFLSFCRALECISLKWYTTTRNARCEILGIILLVLPSPCPFYSIQLFMLTMYVCISTIAICAYFDFGRSSKGQSPRMSRWDLSKFPLNFQHDDFDADKGVPSTYK